MGEDLMREDLMREDLMHEDLMHEDLMHEDLMHKDLAPARGRVASRAWPRSAESGETMAIPYFAPIIRNLPRCPSRGRIP
jgi:hypothetical protein